MSYKLRFSKLAVRDMENVLIYTLNHFGERKHREYRELLKQALKEMAANPRRWPARQRPEIHRDAWTFHIERRGKKARHFFLYRIYDDFVEIGRLLHDSMDIEEHSSGFE